VSPTFTLLLFAACLFAEAFFSGSELGVVSADRMQLRHEASKGSRGAQMALDMLKKPEWLLTTTLIGTNLAVVTGSTLATALAIDLVGQRYAWLAILVVAPLVWIFGEIVPKTVFQQRANAITPKAIYVLKFFSLLFSPVLLVFMGLMRILTAMVGAKRDTSQEHFTLREQIPALLETATDTEDIEPVEQSMIRRLFDFHQATAKDVMVPLIDVVAIDDGATVGEVIRLAGRSSHARFPVYSGRVDKVVGMINALELLGQDTTRPIARWVQPVDYIPDVKNAEALLVEMRLGRQRMSVVVDEFGGAEGIVTIEDIVEEIVEDIEDEYDHKESATDWIKKLGECDYLVSGRVDLDTLAEELDIELPEGSYSSLAGFLLHSVGDMPSKGAVIEHESFRFVIEKAVPQAILEVRIRW